jgi:uncharacterized membrane protein YphA (DoxX/SURF4 family)
LSLKAEIVRVPWNQDRAERDSGGVDVNRTGIGPWLATLARLLVGGVFLVAGVLKLPDPAAAVRAVRAYQLLPESLVAPVAFGLPVLEIAVGLALILGVFVRTAAVVSALMLVVYMVGIGSAWARGLQIDCGCFGSGGPVANGRANYLPDLLRDAGLLIVALALVRWPRSRLALGGRHVEPYDHYDDSASTETEYSGA